MNTLELLTIKKGDQVTYNGSNRSLYEGISRGTILTRGESWMDDEHTVEFTYTTQNGSKHTHFFGVEDIE